MSRLILAVSVAAATMMFGCTENTVSIGNPPPEPNFTVNQSDPNTIIFTVQSAEGFMINWDFGNGKLSQKNADTLYYPFADTYTVSLTASNKGGATTTKKKIIISTTDPKICANQFSTFLTGGCGAPNKTWKIDSADNAIGNGPPSPKDSLGNGTSSYNDQISYWWRSSLTGDKPAPPPRALDDEYLFGLKGFTFKNNCHGDFYFNWKWCNKFFGTAQATYADTIHSYTPNNPAMWTLDVDSVTPEDMSSKDSTLWKTRFFTDSATGKRFNLLLTLSNDNYIGYCSGVSVYQILRINADTMYLRHELSDPDKPSVTGSNREEWRYLRLVTKK